ncbi:MAG: TetR family transcriptional regulator [Christensenellales bacterium]|jgi:AcrR family transcriptional regulator|nr:TetR family transcriptional regulator [Bacillota bacterium]NLK58569.1 TetR/AcrR family transcriptional regulator [Tissierellia bacterium]
MSPRVNAQYRKKKQDAILQSAKKVFTDKGYHRATMQDILLEAGISRGALYSYFNNIEHVFEALLKQEDEEDLAYFSRSALSSSKEQINDWVRRKEKSIASADNAFLLSKTEFFIHQSRATGKERNPYITDRYEKLVNAIKDCIDKGIEQKEFCPVWPSKAIALYLVSFLDGLMLDTFNYGPDITKVNEQMTVFLDSLAKILCPCKS